MAKHSFIVVVGSANVDLTTFNDVFPRPGETIFGEKFDLGFGGKGANQAVAARHCGANVGMVAKVGSDLFGPATIKNFEAQGIDATYVRIAEGVSSGVAPIFVDPSGQNRILRPDLCGSERPKSNPCREGRKRHAFARRCGCRRASSPQGRHHHHAV